MVGIWIIVCIQKPSHHFLQTFPSLRMIKFVFRYSSLYPKQFSLFCLLWLISANFAKRWFGKHEYDVKLWRYKQRTPNTNDTIRHWIKSFMKIFYVRHCCFSLSPCDDVITLRWIRSSNRRMRLVEWWVLYSCYAEGRRFDFLFGRLQRWPESLFQTPTQLLFQKFWIRVQ